MLQPHFFARAVCQQKLSNKLLGSATEMSHHPAFDCMTLSLLWPLKLLTLTLYLYKFNIIAVFCFFLLNFSVGAQVDLYGRFTYNSLSDITI